MGSSSDGKRCSVPRMAHVLAKDRCFHSASRTASGSRSSTRAQRVSSAEDVACACRPQIFLTTPSASSRGVLRSRPWRLTRQASTSGKVSRAFGRTIAPPVRMLTDEFYGRRGPLLPSFFPPVWLHAGVKELKAGFTSFHPYSPSRLEEAFSEVP